MRGIIIIIIIIIFIIIIIINAWYYYYNSKRGVCYLLMNDWRGGQSIICVTIVSHSLTLTPAFMATALHLCHTRIIVCAYCVTFVSHSHYRLDLLCYICVTLALSSGPTVLHLQ
jgi:hypothetical protein